MLREASAVLPCTAQHFQPFLRNMNFWSWLMKYNHRQFSIINYIIECNEIFFFSSCKVINEKEKKSETDVTTPVKNHFHVHGSRFSL